MYIGKQDKKVKTNTKYLVSFCKDCGSQEIEVIKYCKKCGSQDIQNPTLNLLEATDERGIKYEEKEITEYMYKCDQCGGTYTVSSQEDICKTSNYLNYNEGEFNLGYNSDAEENYRFEQDLCPNCLQNVAHTLNEEIQKIVSKEKVLNFYNNKNKTNKNNNVYFPVYNFEVYTIAAPTQFKFQDISGTKYLFRYRNGRYQLYTSDTDKESICFSGKYKTEEDSIINEEELKEIFNEAGFNLDIKTYVENLKGKGIIF